MAPGSLAPAYLKIAYHSDYAPHEATIPVNAPVSVSGATSTWTMATHDSGSANLEAGIADFLEEWAKRFPATVHFDGWSLYTKSSPSAIPLFIGSNVLDVDGTATAGGWDKATQETLTWRDEEGDVFKLVGLDVDAGGGFDRVTIASTIGLTGLSNVVQDPDGFWRSRKDNRPNSFISRTCTLNEKLRRSYRMA